MHLALATDGRTPRPRRSRVGRRARQPHAGAVGAALQLAEHALRLGLREPARFALAASDFAFRGGDAARARELLALATEAGNAQVRAEAWVRLATLATYDGTMAEATRRGAGAGGGRRR